MNESLIVRDRVATQKNPWLEMKGPFASGHNRDRFVAKRTCRSESLVITRRRLMPAIAGLALLITVFE
jgi:hypothetical protein